jgi:hypothetical protein
MKSVQALNIHQFYFPPKIEELGTISCLGINEYITEIQFTPQNNLLVLVESTDGKYSIKLILFKLNLEVNNILKAHQLWSHAIKNIGCCNRAIIFPNSDDKNLLIYTNNFKVLY